MAKKKTGMSCSMKCSCTRVKQCPKCKARENPAKTQAGRVLRIENCPPELASRLLTDRKRAINAGETPPTRYGKCDYRAAEWAIQLERKHGYQAPEGLTGQAASSHWWDYITKMIDRWW